ncbi:hypothetical protein FLL45_15755 [Aliikangiella marina]|uniref:HEAT repeat domain-containing protein n=1 Tax=Aliikangiella marina TaxID=1712262 RepID=A0A545T6R6_9GAMM|nr:hypothetical protein [Aliikangiella marina]TQV72919.1 hypothetical protein FLL45_15755 [Aliikangiella marina]
MNALDIQEKLYKAIDGPTEMQEIRRLMNKLKKLDENIVVEGLLSVFFDDSRGEKKFKDQTMAGGLLIKLMPKYDRNLREDILRSLDNWNLSVEELPWYLAEKVGRDEVLREVESIAESSLSEVARKTLDTYVYWLNPTDTEHFKKVMTKRWNNSLKG